MSNQFYSYLANKISNYFRDNQLVPGAKYNIQFENEEEVRNLYDKLRENERRRDFEYEDNGQVVYKSYSLVYNNVELIVAATIDDVKPDFLTRLRNLVGTEKGYEKRAILFIHNTTLDSIMGGTESFSKESMPFHINSIEKDIKKQLKDKEFSEVDKEIINLDLSNKKKDIFSESNSIFEYEYLVAILEGTCIEREQYRDFGLFFDSDLKNKTGNELKKRLKENSKYYSRVDEIHNYGNPEQQLDRYFDDKGVDKLKDQDWKDTDYKDVKKSVENRANVKPLEYVNSSVEWDKEDGPSKAKLRNRNIIIFNENGSDSVDLQFVLDDYLKNQYIKTEGEVEAKASGMRINVTVKDIEGKSKFYRVTYNDTDKKIKFQFKIVMLNCNEKLLDGIKGKYTIKYTKSNPKIIINSNDSEIIFNESAEVENECVLYSDLDCFNLNNNERLKLMISDDFEYQNDNNEINFTLKIKDNNIPFCIVGTNEKVVPIEGLKVWNLKRQKGKDFKLIGNNKIQIGTKDYFTRDEFRKNLEYEKEIIEQEGLFCIEDSEGIEKVDLDINNDVKEAYLKIIYYYKMKRNLPSLVYLNDEIRELYINFINVYMNALDNIKEESYLSKQDKNLFKLGLLKREIEDKELVFTPLSPMNIAYQLHLNSTLKDDEVSEEVIKKFTSTYLLPYVQWEDDKIYIPMEQFNSPEWKYYVDEKLPRYKSSRDFVSKLVTEKIEEFVSHFKYLFDMSEGAPIRINLINTGDSKEILQGIFKYYVKQLKKDSDKVILPMEIYIYSNRNITNVFEEVAFDDNIENIKSIYGIDLSVEGMAEEDVLDLYRTKVHFYSKKIEEEIEYAHITFIEMGNEIKPISSNMDDIPSGVILDGLVSGVPSTFLGDSYRTGFGTKYANTKNIVMKMATKLNAVNAALSGEPFDSNKCKAISVSNNSKDKLDRVYDSSHWVTFINPKVDLNFFKNDPGAKDLLIIHYSDQYTTAGGYDAITVTRKSGPYQRIIEEFLESKEVENAHSYSPIIINMFNAINGDWLLRLLSSKSHFPKEKISILSAIKLSLALFKMNNIIWVPISLEEVLRVSGGAGLKQTEGFLSAKNLGYTGSTSDDVLLLGFEEDNEEKVNVYYYPVEVKIGENAPNYIQKGIEQAKNTKKIFDDILLPKDGERKDNSKYKVYKNFLMQLAITSAEKLNLYDVCTEEGWARVIDSDLRRKLLNEEYTVKKFVCDEMGEGAVVSFKKDLVLDDVSMNDAIKVVQMSEDDGVNFLTKSINEIREILDKNKIISGEYEVNSDYVIDNKEISDTDVRSVTNDETENNKNDTHIEESYKDNDKVIEEYVCKEETKHEETINEEKPIETKRNMEILFGFNQKNNSEVKWYPNDTDKVFHTNTGIIGTMGTGKTQFTKSMVTQIYRESKYNVDGKKVGILIFDYKGDYNKSKTDFVEATDAKVFELFHLPFNPLSIIKTANSKPMLPLHTANSLKETLAKAFGLGIKQETFLRDLIMEAYEAKGIIKNKPETWDIPAPTLQDVYNIYTSKEDIKEDSLYAAFSNLIDFEIFETESDNTKSLFDLIDGVTVIDLSGYDPGIQNLVVAITLDLFYSQMQAYGHSEIKGNLRQLNKIILVDEADNFLSKNFSSLKKILKEGREFGVGTILSTQLLSHFSTGENEYANYILSWIVHNVADLSTKDVKYIFNTQSKQEEEQIYNKIKNLNKHYSLVKMGDSDRPIYMKDRAFWELIK